MSDKEWTATPGFVPALEYVSLTGNRVMTQDPAYIAWHEKQREKYHAEQEALIESARKKITPEEFDAVVSSGSDY